MKHILCRIIFSLAFIICFSFDFHSQNVISFNGEEYLLDSSTILLDAENIYSSPFACKDAIEAFSKVNEIDSQVTILVAPSVYWLDDPDDTAVRTDEGGTPFAVRLKCNNLRIVGLSNNPEDVVFAVNRGQTQGAVGNFTMFQFSGEYLQTENITFGNYCNIDLVYPRNSSFNRCRRKDAIVQAQIGICDQTDRLYAKNCRFLSRLNLCPFVGARRSLYDNCYFESTDDALSGSAVYLDCKFLFCSSKPFYTTAKTGAVFLNCDITSLCSGDQYFTKVPGQVTVLDTRFHGADNLRISWTRDASDLKCFQSNVSLNGLDYTIDAQRPELWVSLDGNGLMDAYAVEYNGKKIYNLPNLLNGQDGWDPKNLNPKVAEAEKALGRKLTGIPVSMAVKVDKNILAPQNDTARVVATPLLWGSFPADGEDTVLYVSDNHIPVQTSKIINFTLPNGLTANQTISILPDLKPAPSLVKGPKIKFDINRKAYYVEYRLKGKGIDDSMIYWARIFQDIHDSKVLLLKKNNSSLGKIYRPVMGDYGSQIIAVVVPKFKDSKPGDISMSSPIAIEDIDDICEIPESSLTTDFKDIPIAGKALGFTSVWSFDVFKPLDTSHITNWEVTDGPGWYWGKGYDASISEGIVQSARGARMSYVPTRDACMNMSVDIVVEPAKSGGQGFGSATAQYMDICLKFDPLSLDGYALRIERTPDYDKAVKFSLIRYDKGKTSVINPGVVSNCYRTPCSIHTEIKDGILSACAHTDAGFQSPGAGVVENVSISVPVEDSYMTGFCIQHTGSTGPSSTLIKNLKLSWD